MPEIFRRRLRPSESLQFSVGRIFESDILGIAAMYCNDGSIKDFVGYKYPAYACCDLLKKRPQNDLACNQYPKIKYFMLIRRSDFM